MADSSGLDAAKQSQTGPITRRQRVVVVGVIRGRGFRRSCPALQIGEDLGIFVVEGHQPAVIGTGPLQPDVVVGDQSSIEPSGPVQ
jgi:hypothetical protein